jgi:hypothetical protein
MSGLQTATDIVALAFMGSIILIMFGLLAAVLVIKHKVNTLHTMVQEKIDMVEKMATPLDWIAKNFKKK